MKIEEIAEMGEDDICYVKAVVMTMYYDFETARETEFAACYICDGYNYNCVDNTANKGGAE